VIVEGREAHSAYPSLGASAVFRAARLIKRLESIAEKLKQDQHDAFDPPYTTLNIGLELGAVSELVTVTGFTPLLRTDRADVATSFDARQLTDLPVLDRNFTKFILLTPGTQQLQWQHAASENPQGSTQTMVNGQHFSGTTYQLDGTENRDPILGIIVVTLVYVGANIGYHFCLPLSETRTSGAIAADVFEVILGPFGVALLGGRLQLAQGALRVGGLRLAQGELGLCLDAGERRAQLVRRVGDKALLRR